VLQRACEIQVLSGSIPGPNIPISREALELSARDPQAADPQRDMYHKVFAAAVRRAGIAVESLA
jgi:hypothetical protein